LSTLGPASVAVIEAALLVETESFRRYDLLAVVWCSPAQQLERAVGRGMSDERARGLIAAQIPLDNKRELADVVIDNSKPRDVLDTEVARAWSEILTACRSRA
jgi:dephospho-CoA kinase